MNEVAALAAGSWVGSYDVEDEFGPLSLQIRVSLESAPRFGVLVAPDGCEVPERHKDGCAGLTVPDAASVEADASVWSVDSADLRVFGSVLSCARPEAPPEGGFPRGCPLVELEASVEGQGGQSLFLVFADGGKLWAHFEQGERSTDYREIGSRE